MESSKFFRVVWRANALLILGVGVIGLFVGAYAARELMEHLFRARHTSDLVPAQGNPKQTKVEEGYRLGTFSEVRGTEALMANVISTTEHALLLNTKSSASSRNILFFYPSTRTSHYLFADHKQLILASERFPEDSHSNPEPLQALGFQTVSRDSNGDGNWSENDLSDYHLYSSHGKSAQKILANIQHRPDWIRISPKRWGVSYQKQGQYYFAEVDMANRKVLSTTELPKP